MTRAEGYTTHLCLGTTTAPTSEMTQPGAGAIASVSIDDVPHKQESGTDIPAVWHLPSPQRQQSTIPHRPLLSTQGARERVLSRASNLGREIEGEGYGVTQLLPSSTRAIKSCT